MSLNFSRRSAISVRLNYSPNRSECAQARTVAASFFRSPKLGKNGFTLIPDFSLAFRRSHLLRNMINVTLDSNLEEQIARHRRNESSSRLTLGSSINRSSKQDTAGEGEKQMLVDMELKLAKHWKVTCDCEAFVNRAAI